MSGIEEIKNKLQEFKNQYYKKKLLVGFLVFLISSSSLFFFVNGLEYQLWMSSLVRGVLFFASILILTFSFYWLVISPIASIFKLKRGLSDVEAAQEIAKSIPGIEDRLLNTLQLHRLSSEENSLIQAAIDKKAASLKKVSFIQAVDFNQGRKYGLILLAILICLGLVSFVNPSLFKDSTNRIVNFNQEFTPEAPFSFVLPNNLRAFRGEDYILNVEIKGSSVPESLIALAENNQKLKFKQTGPSSFQYVFNRIQKSISFQLDGGGYKSRRYTLEVNNRPDLIAMSIAITSPGYTGGGTKLITNSGDITAFEGSSVTWKINTQATDSMQFYIGAEPIITKRLSENAFGVDQRVFRSNKYSINLSNPFGKNISELSYSISIIKDEKPEISAEYFPDSLFYQFVTVAGNIIDDHGFTRLSLNYRMEDQSFRSFPIELSPGLKKQSFYSNWKIDSLKLSPGDRLEFFVSVSDNDQVNGPKTSKSKTFFLQVPDAEELEKIIDKKSQTVENQLDNSKKEAESINERLQEIEEKLKSEQDFDWQERKQLNDIIEDREELAKQIEELQKQHQELQQTSDQFNKRSDQVKQQNEQLQNLLDELLDEKTRELYEKLKELLKENNPSTDEVRQELQDIQKNEKNLERELDRALELFKRLKMESALEQNLQKLDSLSQRQEQLAEENTEESNQSSIQERQEEIQKEFEDFREEMDKVEQLNQELKRPEPLQDFELEERQISRELREIDEQLQQQAEKQENQQSENENAPEQSEPSQSSESQQQQDRTKTQQKQKSASQRMKQLSKRLSKMQAGMQMEMMQANLDQLRDILDNLVKLSFNQEGLMKEMREVNQSDPRFLELSQAQLKLKDDAKVIQDSLLSLAENVAQISSFITREVGNINDNIDGALDQLKDRNRGRALSSQQFAMTSINNLALLLDDTMQQMQMAMSEAMGNPQQGDQKQQGLPDLQELQQQLGEQMNELKGSGKQGRELSEELARLAAEQELIRRQLEMIRQAEEGKPGGGLGEDLQRAIQQMEQNEIDLVNKRLTQQLINRQKSIETRLLEAEKAQREQELEEEREAESPTSISRELPPAFEEYLKLKQKEIELLKTIPAELNQFYKKEVNDYFRRISSQEKRSEEEDDR